MPVTLTLSTMPGTLTRNDRYTSILTKPFGPSLATETLTAISTVADIRVAVARFGARVHAEHPEESFYVSVCVAKGCRKPNGYDAASRGNGLGQEDFLHVTDTRTKQAEPAAVPGAPATLTPLAA